MKKIAFSFMFIILVLGVLKFLTFSTDTDDEQIRKAFADKFQVYNIEIPTDLSFAGEVVPLTDYDVYERTDREFLVNVYWQSNTVLLLKRAHRWMPYITHTLKQYGIPEDFKFIPLIESGLTNSTSPAGAVGFWQLVAGTAKGYGLQVDEVVDERYNVEKSTIAACKYFKEAYRQLGSWTLVAASYNMGMTGIQKQLNRQKTDCYYDLLLNGETSRYVFRVLAIKELYNHPEKYGYKLRKKDLYYAIPTYSVAIDTAITDLAQFAIDKGLSYKILKNFNPWLRDNFLKKEEGKAYTFLLPKEGYEHQSPFFGNVVDSSGN